MFRPLNFTQLHTRFSQLAATKIIDLPTLLDLIQDQSIFRPLVSRKDLKSVNKTSFSKSESQILYKVSDPLSVESHAAVSKLFRTQKNLSSPTSFIFQYKEDILKQHIDEAFVSALDLACNLWESSYEAETCCSVADLVTETEIDLHFQPYATSFAVPGIIYRDLYTAQIVGSILE